MSVYIVKANYPNQGNNLGVHSSQAKAQDHFKGILCHYTERGGKILRDDHWFVDLGNHSELRQTLIDPGHDPGHEHIRLVLERW